jgi:hypothetical protein
VLISVSRQSLRYYGIKIVKRAFAYVRRAVAIAADRERRSAERFEPFVRQCQLENASRK